MGLVDFDILWPGDASHRRTGGQPHRLQRRKLVKRLQAQTRGPGKDHRDHQQNQPKSH